MNNLSFFHGAAILELIRHESYQSLAVYEGNNSSYVVNGTSGIYIKYSQKRLPPWTFTFSTEHVNDIIEMHQTLERMYVTLVCHVDGVCCLGYEEFSTVFAIENESYPKWLSISRMKGEKYSVKGSDGELQHKIGRVDFPRKVY